MNYRLALDKLKNYAIGEVLKSEETLKELVNEKLEQESRKNFLKAGSKWECIATNTLHFQKTDKTFTFEKGKMITLDMEIGCRVLLSGRFSCFTEQFLSCFKPINEGDKNEILRQIEK